MEKIKRYLDFMVCVLQADGEVHEMERQLLGALMANFCLSQEMIDTYNKKLDTIDEKNIDETLERVAKGIDRMTLTCITRDAYIMAGIDENFHPAEMKLIRTFLEKAGIPEDRLDIIESWGRETFLSLKRGFLLMERGTP